PGRLAVEGPQPEYVLREIAEGELQRGQSGGGRWYAHAVIPTNYPPKSEAQELKVELARGVTVKGKLITPDGKPATGVQVFSRLLTSARMLIKQETRPVPVPESGFEFHAVDPEKPYPVVFLDEKKEVGAIVSISGKQATAPLMVKPERCGKAIVRFVDKSGK